jgi:predicted transcriptional regulator of viral defense system
VDRRAQLDAIAAIQARQMGLITADQARAKGVASDVLHQEVRVGRLRRVRTGVFAVVGAPISYQQELLGAVLAAGGADGLAAASHATAAYEFCLPLPSRDRPAFEVTTPLDRKPVIRGVRLHRSGHLTARDITRVGAIPVTTASRTIVDLSMRLDRGALGSALDEGLRRRVLTLGQ